MAPLISDDELNRIEKGCDAATPGPWASYVEGREEMSGSSFIMTGGEDFYVTGCTASDQDFMASARQDIPKLIAEVRRLRSIAKAAD
ncbi:MAG: hypothetical protein ABL904_16570 [Hyphomicrobiaceae bacterium]